MEDKSTATMDDINGSDLVIDINIDNNIDQLLATDQKDSCPIEQNVMSAGVESTVVNENVAKTVLTTVIEVVETGGQTTGDAIIGSDSAANCQPMAESVDKPNDKYIRSTTPEMLPKIWRIVGPNNWYKSAEDFQKYLLKSMFTEFNIKFSDKQIKQLVEKAINDKLLLVEQSADQQIRYVPNFDRNLFGKQSNDWYCFECHSCIDSQPLIGCQSCMRSYHTICLKLSTKTLDKMNCSFRCSYCKSLEKPDNTLNVNLISKSDLNKCLSLVLNNLQLSFLTEGFDNFIIDDNQQNSVLIFKPIDLLSIRHKTLTDQYDSLDQFVGDFHHFFHNFVVAKRDRLSELKEFQRRFNHELKELKLCVDCYKYSSDLSYDSDDDPYNWFTLVCDPPHELVFAKYSKYPFWPSKVIDIKPGGRQYDVRFFDPPNFSRAVVPISRLKPIEGFRCEDEDNDLGLPLQLLDKHMKKMREKGVHFIPTIVSHGKGSTKKRTDSVPNKKSKKDKK